MIRKQQSRGFKRFQVGSVLAIAVAGVTALAPRARATTKDNNNINLNQALSWVGGVTPDINGDVAVFDGTFATGNSALLLGGNVNWLGVQLLNPVQAVTINAGNTLTLGASGIDTTQSLFNFTLNPSIQLNGTAQTWNVGGPLIVGGNVNAGGGTLTINTASTAATAQVSGIISNGTVLLSGTGNATLSGNDSAGQIVVNSGTTTLLGVKTVGSVTLNGGRMNLGSSTALGFGKLILNGGSFDNLSGGAMTLNTIPITLNGNVTFVGSSDLNLGIGAITVATASTLTLTNHVLTLGSAINTNFNFTVAGSAGALNMAATNNFGTASTFTLAGGQLNVTGTSMVQAGTIAITGGVFNNTSGAPLVYNSQPFTFGGSFTYTGSQNITINSAVSLTANTAINLSSNSMTINSNIGSTANSTLTKTGAGELILTGTASNWGGALVVGSGTVTLTGSATNPAASGTADIIGNVAGSPAVLNLTGSLISAKTSIPSIAIGNIANSIGSLKMSAGTLTSTSEFHVGQGAGAYAAFSMSGGVATVGVWTLVGQGGDHGIVNLTGGTLTETANAMQIGNGGTNPLGIFNVAGGTYVATSTGDAGANIELGTNSVTSSGIFNLLSGNVKLTAGIQLNQSNTSSAIVNLDGGTLSATRIYRTSTTGTTGVLNFNGTRVVAAAATTGFFTALSAINVWGGGAIFDDNGNAVTLGQGLVAPAGSGISSITVTGATTTNASASSGSTTIVLASSASLTAGMTVFGTGIAAGTTITSITGTTLTLSGGTAAAIASATPLQFRFAGFIDTPTIQITGGGGVGATAVANIGTDGSLTSVTITSPGTGYTNGSTAALTPTIAIFGGSASAIVSGFSVTSNANSGGFTKFGSSVVTMATQSTYTGTTTVNSGTLTLNFSANAAILSNLVSSSSPLAINGASLIINGATNAAPGNHSQGFAGTTIGSGSGLSSISVLNNGTNSYLLSLGSLTRQAGGAVSFTLPNGAQTSTNGITTTTRNSDFTGVGGKQSILGGWATVGTASGVASSWAISAGFPTSSGNITALAIFSGTFAAGQDVDAPTGATAVGGPLTINSLRLNTPGSYAIDATGGLTIASGGILYTPNDTTSGATVTINNGTLASAQPELFVNQYNTVNTMSIGSAISAASLVKTGGGTLNLTNAVNNITGKSLVYGGVLGLAADASLGNAPGGVVVDQLTLSGGGIQLLNQFNLNSNRGILLNSTGTFDTNGFNSTYGGVISGANSGAGLTKLGNGTLTLSGAETFSGPVAVRAGALELTGSIATGISSAVTIGNTANVNTSLVMSGGTITANKTTAPSVQVGSVANADGDIRMNSGVINTASEFWLGDNGAGAYAALTMNGGTITSGSWFVVGSTLDRAAFNMNGGSFTVATNRMTVGAGATTSIAVANMSGGTFTAPVGIFVGELGTAALNEFGTAMTVGNVGIGQTGAGSNGVVNLLGGTLSTGSVTRGAGTARFNFNGGTLKATGASTTFLTGLSNTYIWGNNANIDTGAFAVTIGQNLLTPASQTIGTITLTNGGTGYTAVPTVTINNASGGAGTGATAVATIDTNSGMVTSVVITSPGSLYTTNPTNSAILPTITISGGGTSAGGATASVINLALAQGLTGISVTGGIGYIDTPLVSIAGNGVGATAIASIDATGALTGITITNPGIGYTAATVTLTGGGAGSGGAVVGALTFSTIAGGGLNKVGTGSLTLSGAGNTYTGPTNLTQGTTIVSGTLNGLGAISVASGAVLRMAGGNVSGIVTINSGGSLSGAGLISSIVNIASGAAIDLGSGPSGTAAVGTLIVPNLNIDVTTARGIMRFDYDGPNVNGGSNGSNDLLLIGTNSTSPTYNPINVNGTNPIVVYLNALGLGVPNQTEVLATFSGSAPSVILDPNSSHNGFDTVSISTGNGSNGNNTIFLTTAGKTPPTTAYWTGNFGTTWTALDSLLFNDNFNDAPVNGNNTNQYPSQTSDVVFSANTTNSSFATTLGTIGFDIRGLSIQTGIPVSIGGTSVLTLEDHGITNGATAGGLTISAPVALGSPQTWTNLSGSTLIDVPGVISGGSNSTLTIVGNVRLDGANTFTGGVNIGAGTLTAANAAALSNRSLNFVNGAGGHLELAGNSVVVNSIAGDSSAIIEDSSNTSATFTFNSSFANSTFAGVIQNGSGTGVTSLLVTGGGTLTTTGMNTYTGSTTVRGGKLVLGAGQITTSTAGNITFGDTAGANGVMVVNGGTLTSTGTATPSFRFGITAGSAGALYVNSGVVDATAGEGEFFLATVDGGYGAMILNNGVISTHNWIGLGRLGGQGVLIVNGGTLTSTSGNLAIGADNVAAENITNIHGVADFTGGTTTLTGSILLSYRTNAILNVRGGLVTAATMVMFNDNISSNQISYANLIGGTLSINGITNGAANATHTSLLNFNGGVLQARASTANFIVPISTASVYAGGVIIDDGGFSIGINEPLIAPTGSGVSAAGLTINGSGFIAPPVIQISGGGGLGATAVANLDANGNFTGITITNPGFGYNSTAVTFTVLGGGSTTGTITGTPTIVANDTSGGFTKRGTGTITLGVTGTNYRGDTVVNSGTLMAGTQGAFSPFSVLRVYNGGVVDGQNFSVTSAGLDDSLGTPGVASNFGTLTLDEAAGKSYLFSGTVLNSSLIKTGLGSQTLAGSSINFINLSVNSGLLVLKNGVNVSSSGSLTFGGAEGTLQLTLGSGGSNIISMAAASRTSGAAGNIVLTDGSNGVSNGLTLTSATGGLIDQGTFFNGADYAMVDPITKFVRAPVYGTDATFSAADSLNTGTNVLIDAAATQAPGTSFTTVKLSGGAASLAQGGNQLSTMGILKSGGGSATISGGTLQATFNGGTAAGDFVVRVDGSDTLTISSAILDNVATNFVKSGSGVLVLSNANTFSGKMDLLNGTLVVANASALQSSLVTLIAGQGTIQFATGTNTAVFGGLTSSTTNPGTITLQDQSAAPVNLIVQISDSPTLALSGDGFSRINVMNGLITGSGSLTILSNNTDGRYDFNAANTFTGGVTILSGRVQANQQVLGPNSLDSSFGTGLVTLAGGTFTTHGSNLAVAFNNNFLFNGSASFNTASASNATLNGNISGSGTVVRGGTGTLVFNGTGNSGFTGTFLNTAGNVTFTNLGAVPGAGATFNFANTAAIAINTSVIGTMAFGNLSGIPGANLTVTNTNTATGNSLTGTLQIGALGGATTFAGNITVASSNALNSYILGLQKMGAGTLTLQGTASNFYGSTVSAGTLAVTSLDGGTFGTSSSQSTGTTLILTSAAGNGSVAVGEFVTGASVQAGTTVSAISANGLTVTLSAPLAGTNNVLTPVQFLNANALGVAGSVTIATNATLQYTGAAASSAKLLSVANNSGLDASGTGAVNFANTGALLWDAPGVARTLNLTGTSLAANNLAAQIADNGAGSVTLVKSGTGVWSLSNSNNTSTGGMIVNGGTLLLANSNNSVGNSGGASMITVNATGALGGTGGTTAPITVNSGGQINPGPVTGNHVGTLFIGGSLNLSAGSILTFDLAGPGLPNDALSLFGTGTVNMAGGSGSVGVNLFNAGLNSSYFFNGTYNLFTGISAANATTLTSQIGALHTINEDTTSGATFTFSVATGAVNNLLLTVAGGWNSSSWSNANSSNTWTDSGDWIGGVPNGSGHVATFGTLVANGGTITMNGSKAINRLVFSNANSFTINPTGADTLFIQNGTTNVASVVVQAGSHFINSSVELDAGTTAVAMSTSTSLTLGSNVTGAGGLVLSGSGALIFNGAASYSGGTTISQNTSVLQIGNGGATGSLAGGINLTGTLIFDRSNVVSFDPANLVQTNGTGTLTQSGTGTLILSTATPGAIVPGQLAATAGVIQFGTDEIMNLANTSFNLSGTGKIDMNGHTEEVRAIIMNGGIIDNTSATAATLFVHSGAAVNMAGTITNSGSGPLSIIKDGAGTITVQGLFNNAGSLYISGGQVIFTNTASTALSGLIVMARTATGTTGLIMADGTRITSPLLINASQGSNDFVGTLDAASATFAGNVTVDPAAAFNSNVQVRLGNVSATGTLIFAGGTITIPSGTKGLVSRNTVTLAGNELVDDQDPSNPFQIGNPGNALTLISAGNSTLQTAVSDFGIGMTLGSTGNTVNSVHTIQDNAIVRVGIDGGSLYDLQPSTASASSNTLNINGGSLMLGQFFMTGAQASAGIPGVFPQANVIFNGGAVVAGLNFNDIAPSFGPSNMKFTIGAGGMTLDINQKSGVQWSTQLTSSSSGTAFTDGGLAYISGSGAGTITLATRQLYKGATTIGRNAVVIVPSNDVLGDPSVGAAVNFAGGTLSMTGNLALSLQDGSSATLTHRFSFNSSDPLFDSVAGFDNGTPNLNATYSGGKVLMSGMANSSQSTLLGVTDINSGIYTTNGATFMAWYTTNSTPANSYVFSIGGTGSAGGFQYLQANANSGGNFRAFISTGGNSSANGGGSEINAQAPAPSNGVEHQMAVTIDNSNISLYLDGILKQTTPLTTANGAEILQNIIDQGVFLGGSVWTADPSLNGSVDEFRVYDTVLSQQYIAASFNASADTLAPTVAVNRNITVANSTVSGASGGAVDLAHFELDVGGNISGAGTLNLFDGGTMVLTGNSSAGLNIDPSVLLLVGTGSNLGALTGGNVANSGKIIINRNDTASIWGASISGAGTITHSGSGTTTITGTNTYTGPLLVNAGKLLVGNNGTTGTLGSGQVTLAGVLGFNRSDTFAVAANITGGGTVTQVGSGITQVSGNNSYTGGTIFAGGELEVDSANAIGTTGTLSFTGGALRYSATNTSNYQSRFSTAANQLYAFDTNGQTITFTSPLTSTGTSALSKLGAGTLVLTTTNSYQTTNVSGGVLQVNSGADVGAGNINFNGPGTLAYNRTGTAVVSNTITGSGGTLSQLVGTSILTGTNTFSGGVNIASGATIQIGNGAGVGSIGTAGVSNSGTLNINRTGLLTIAGPVTGAGTLNHNSSGTTTLAGLYGASGPVNINAGQLAFGPTAAVRQDTGVMVNIKSLSMGSGTVLDSTNRDLLIGNTTLLNVETKLVAAFGVLPNGNPSSPTDPIITSSTAVSAGNTFLVPIDADSILGTGAPGSAINQTWDNVTITQPGTVIVKYTYAGDADLNGQVDFGDYTPILSNFGKTTPGLADIETSWLMGDLDLSGVVDFGDYTPILSTFGQGVGNPLGTLDTSSAGSAGSSLGGSSNVPEPASLALLGIGAAGLLLRRKKR